MLSRLAIIFIRIYQLLISPYLGTNCRFYPSCSSYAITVYKEWGFIMGTWLTFRRLLRCGPWTDGGVDLPPKKLTRGEK